MGGLAKGLQREYLDLGGASAWLTPWCMRRIGTMQYATAFNALHLILAQMGAGGDVGRASRHGTPQRHHRPSHDGRGPEPALCQRARPSRRGYLSQAVTERRRIDLCEKRS